MSGKRKKAGGFFICAAGGALAGAMLVFPKDAAEAALSALRMWAVQVVPALFPMMILMPLIVSRIRGGDALRVVFGLLSGSPGGAKLCAPRARDARQAKRFAAMTGVMSPMFFLSTVSGWLQSPTLGAAIYACHALSALLTGLIFFPGGKAAEKAETPPEPVGFSEALNGASLAMCAVAGCIVLGTAASRMLSQALPFLPPGLSAALACALEVTGGIKALAELPLALKTRGLLITAAASLGGLSLLMQNAVYWKTLGPGRLLRVRACHAVLSCALFCLISPLI